MELQYMKVMLSVNQNFNPGCLILEKVGAVSLEHLHSWAVLIQCLKWIEKPRRTHEGLKRWGFSAHIQAEACQRSYIDTQQRNTPKRQPVYHFFKAGCNRPHLETKIPVKWGRGRKPPLPDSGRAIYLFTAFLFFSPAPRRLPGPTAPAQPRRGTPASPGPRTHTPPPARRAGHHRGRGFPPVPPRRPRAGRGRAGPGRAGRGRGAAAPRGAAEPRRRWSRSSAAGRAAGPEMC